MGGNFGAITAHPLGPLRSRSRSVANPGARWAVDPAEPAALGQLPRGGGLPQSGDDSSHLAADSPQSSPLLLPDSPHLEANSHHLPPELLSLAEPARTKGKLPAAEMQALVLQLCDGRWLTSKDLAALLNRDAENLQGRILGGMVRKGLLELRFPDVPNRPDQAYRAVEGDAAVRE